MLPLSRTGFSDPCPGGSMLNRRVLLTLVALSTFLLGASATHAQVTALRFGRLIDGHGGVVKDAVVVVEGERISKVGSGDSAIPPNAKVIDLRRYTAIPGLIDAHTHMTFYWDQTLGTRPWAQ